MSDFVPQVFAGPSLAFEQGVHIFSPKKNVGDPDAYVSLREKEGRICTDELLRGLPKVPREHPHADEWALRARSSERLLAALRLRFSDRPFTALELGCGNGWLAAQVAQGTQGSVIGVDNNLPELQQAARVFAGPRMHWVLGDVFDLPFRKGSFEAIYLAASVQYFPDLGRLLERLGELLSDGGEIHVLDSPIYRGPAEAKAAAERSRRYYAEQGHPEMSAHYHHHTWEEVAVWPHRAMHAPNSFRNRLRRWCGFRDSPFPHLVFSRRKGAAS
jgi:SAM-dependent methyltransferase